MQSHGTCSNSKDDVSRDTEGTSSPFEEDTIYVPVPFVVRLRGSSAAVASVPGEGGGVAVGVSSSCTTTSSEQFWMRYLHTVLVTIKAFWHLQVYSLLQQSYRLYVQEGPLA